MSHSKRREQKKRLREKRLAERGQSKRSIEGTLQILQRLSGVLEPRSWPGAVDPSLNRPDRVKFELGTFAGKDPGRDLSKKLERRLKQGLLDFIPELDHWGMEEFFWHGFPGNSWHPIDHFLRNQANRFPEAAQAQLLQWKEARIGCYEVGEVADDIVFLREVDVFTALPVGGRLRAIALNIGGVNAYAREKGKYSVTYLAPWSPQENLFCAMGYGLFVSAKQFAMAAPLVKGLRNIQAITSELPWRAGTTAARFYLEQWNKRDWFQFMVDHVRYPFKASVATDYGPQSYTIQKMITRTTEEAQHAGLYFAVGDTAKFATGGSTIIPLDFASENAMVFAEYREFRRIVGPPPASRGRF